MPEDVAPLTNERERMSWRGRRDSTGGGVRAWAIVLALVDFSRGYRLGVLVDGVNEIVVKGNVDLGFFFNRWQKVLILFDSWSSADRVELQANFHIKRDTTCA